MKKTLFKIMITALSVVLFISAVPFTASAEAVALGNESPFISAQFLDSNNEEVDGNALVANQTYTVNLALSDISSVAIFNLTADITDDITITDVTSVADIENSSFEYGGYKNDTDNNRFVIVISTVNNTTYTELNGETVMVTLTVEVHTDGDFADFFNISTDRNRTFIIANFEEGNEAAYVYKDNEQTATDYPFLDFDMSPSTTITVTGTVKVATDEYGNGYAPDSTVIGATVSVFDADNEVVATTTTDENGQFSLVIREDSANLTIYKYFVNERTITLSGNAVTDYPSIPVVAVDYDSNGVWGAGDNGLFKAGYDAKDVDMDLDGNGAWGAGDNGIYDYFSGKSIKYSSFTL